jgi:hypothetical protein
MGSGVQRRVEGKTGQREGAPGAAGTARVAGISPRPAGAGGAVVA